MFAFIQGFTPASVAATPDIASYVEAILSLYLAFGLAFYRCRDCGDAAGAVWDCGYCQTQNFRGYFIVVAFHHCRRGYLPDVISQLALAVPMCLLYEVEFWGQLVCQENRRKTMPSKMPKTRVCIVYR